jgi:hypothetical protein
MLLRLWSGAARLFGRLGQNLGCSHAPGSREKNDEVVSARGASFERCTIAIADSVAAPMVGGPDHNGAMSTPHARASSSRRSRRRGDCLPSSKRGVSILQLWCTLNVCMRLPTCIYRIFGISEGNMAKKAKKAKKTAKKKK